MEAPRRFAGVARLFGEPAFGRISAAHVCVVGVGGVGSWAAEALARSGVGRITLIDLDHVAESNLNRQVLALESTLGAAKVDAMRARSAAIAPGCSVTAIDEFVTPENAASIVPADAIVIDAIDQVRAKAALVALCRGRAQPVIVCGAAGGRHDPLRLQREDLARVSGDSLLSSLRARLRRDHGFEREAGRAFGVPVIHSTEQRTEPPSGEGGGSGDSVPGAALACSGYGSIVTVTAAMGLAAAAWAIDLTRTGMRKGAIRRSAPRPASGAPDR